MRALSVIALSLLWTGLATAAPVAPAAGAKPPAKPAKAPTAQAAKPRPVPTYTPPALPPLPAPAPLDADTQRRVEAARAAMGGYSSGAIELWRPLAEAGVAEAQYQMGLVYAFGIRVCKSEPVGADWFGKAAAQDYAPAQRELGLMYRSSSVFAATPDHERIGEEWLLRAALHGDMFAQRMLGVISTAGQPTPEQYAKAAYWYEKAAEQGSLDAMVAIAGLYRAGHGVARDYAKALVWYRKAAEQDVRKAETALGEMYEAGQGVAKDEVQAYVWYSLATTSGVYMQDSAGDGIKRLQARLSPAQIAAAEAKISAIRTIHPTQLQSLAVPPVRRADCPA